MADMRTAKGKLKKKLTRLNDRIAAWDKTTKQGSTPGVSARRGPEAFKKPGSMRG